jgi:DNA-binding beta-propeller fold protein YncE
MSTLLRYDLTTNPFPLQASPESGDSISAALTVVASNPKADPVKNPVTLKGFSIKIPVGPDASELTSNATSIKPIAPSGWTAKDPRKGSGSVEYQFIPDVGQGSVGRQGIAFVLNDIKINTQTGTVEVTIKEGSRGNPVAKLFVTKFPHGWGQVSFRVDPADIPEGDSTTLHWTGPQGATYTIEYSTPDGEVVNLPTTGQPALGNNGQYPSGGNPPLTLERTTVFTLDVTDTVEGQLYQAQLQKTVTVDRPPPVITLFMGELRLSGTSVVLTLDWETTGADTCRLSGDPHPLNTSSPDGGYRISPTAASPLLNLYTLTAHNASGQVTSQIALEWGTLAATAPVGILPTGVAASPDNTRIVAAGASTGAMPSTLTVLDPLTLEPIAKPNELSYRPYSLAYSRDASKIYVGAEDGNVYVFDVFSRQTESQVFPVGSIVQGIAVSPDGARIYASAWNPGAIYVFDANTQAPIGQPIRLPTMGNPKLPVSPLAGGIAISPDNSQLFVFFYYLGFNQSVVNVYKPTTDPKNPLLLIGSLINAGGSVAVSPDGNLVFVLQSNNTIQTFDPVTLQPVGKPFPLAYGPNAISPSPDGSRIYLIGAGMNDPVLVYVPSAVTGGTSG